MMESRSGTGCITPIARAVRQFAGAYLVELNPARTGPITGLGSSTTTDVALAHVMRGRLWRSALATSSKAE
jgi:hypothetical protein